MLKQFAIFLFLVEAAFGQGVWFEPNQGQVHRSVEFLARSGGGYVYFGRNKMAVRDVGMDLIGANRTSEVEFGQPTGGISSYFIGRTEKDWHTGIPHYERVQYRNVYAEIDLVYYGSGRNVEFDFVVRPGGDPNQIRLAYNKPVRMDENGDLSIAGLQQNRPKVYQNGHEIACEYLFGEHNEVRLSLAEYDHSQALTVDPVLEFSTYLGGVAEEGGYGLAFDAQGYVYLCGASQAPATPELNPFQQTTALINSPVVFKFTPDGQKILYYAFVGNGAWDQALGIGVDANGSAVITGDTRNASFPLKNAFQTQYKAIYGNAFISKLSPDGKSLMYSSYIGGSNQESGNGIALDSLGNALITGTTQTISQSSKPSRVRTAVPGIVMPLRLIRTAICYGLHTSVGAVMMVASALRRTNKATLIFPQGPIHWIFH
jgi:Beta-propeller repeat